MTEQPTTDPAAPAQADPPARPETDWKAEAKKWETRAKENKTAADELTAIKAAQMSEAEKNAKRLAEAEKAAADATREALKFKIAAKFQIGDEDADLFLTGDDEATLTKQAERLQAREAENKRGGLHVPREGNTPTTTTSDEKAFAHSLFSGGSR